MAKVKSSCGCVNEEQKQKEKGRRMKSFAVGTAVIGVIAVTVSVVIGKKRGIEMRKMCKSKVLDTVEKTMDSIQDRADAVHATAEHAAKAASKAIENIDNNSNELNEEIKEGYHDVKNDIHKTVENIASDLKKAER